MGQRLLQRPSYGCLYKGSASYARRRNRSPSAAHRTSLPSPESPAVTGRRVSRGYGLGDAGLAALAEVLPSSLEFLSLRGTGLGDDGDGLVAIAAALPNLTRLQHLDFSNNSTPGERGWVALLKALPSMPALKHFDARGASSSLRPRSKGFSALLVAVPQCPRLEKLHVTTPALQPVGC